MIKQASDVKHSDEHAIRISHGLKFQNAWPKNVQFRGIQQLFESATRQTWKVVDNLTKTKRKYAIMVDITIAEIES